MKNIVKSLLSDKVGNLCVLGSSSHHTSLPVNCLLASVALCLFIFFFWLFDFLLCIFNFLYVFQAIMLSLSMLYKFTSGSHERLR